MFKAPLKTIKAMYHTHISIIYSILQFLILDFSASTAVATSCLFFNASLFEHSEFDALKNKQLVATAVEALIAHSKSGSRVVMTSCSFCTQGKSKLWLKVK